MAARAHQSEISPRTRAVRVAFLWPFGERTPTELSGMPWAMEHALRDAGLDVIPVLGPRRDSLLPRGAVEVVLGRGAIRRKAKTIRRKVTRMRDDATPDAAVRRHLLEAREGVAEMNHAIQKSGADVIFGCCVSRALSAIKATRPIVYFSDTTARLITTTYPAYIRRSAAYKRACDKLEQTALDRADVTCFATEVARQSAIDTYECDPSRVHVAPMGAHITPSDLADPIQASPLPSRDQLELVVTAADAERKQTDLCVDITAALRLRSINAHLTIIGEGTTHSRSVSGVTHAGRLNLACESDRAAHAAVLQQAHLALQPSLAEAFGIAPCEAAAFGAPSIVSTAGGLAEVVQHDHTGLVLPIDATADDYADAIASLIATPDRYQAMSEAALERAERALNWSSWGKTVARLIRHAAVDAPAHEVTIATAIRRRTLTPSF